MLTRAKAAADVMSFALCEWTEEEFVSYSWSKQDDPNNFRLNMFKLDGFMLKTYIKV